MNRVFSWNWPVIVCMFAAAFAWAHPGSGIVVLPNGDVCFTSGNSIRRVDTNGQVTVLIEDAKHDRFYQLHHLFIDARNNLYTAADTGSGIWRVSTDGKLDRAYPPPNEDRAVQVGLGGDPFCIDDKQNVWAINTRQNRFAQVIKMDRDGRIVWTAGGDWGHADGQGARARFGELHGSSFALGDAGTLYLTDDGRFVRAITASGEVSTLAGDSAVGFADGRGVQARFRGAAGLVVAAVGVIYLADSGNHRIRKVARDGTVTTLAGSGAEGAVDGHANLARFQEPTGVAVNKEGVVYVLEAAYQRVRRIGSDGRVTTVASGTSTPR